MEPVMKWAGGKRQILRQLNEVLRPLLNNNTYFEPFVGGGSVFLSLEYNHVVINDSNNELINVYNQIRDNPEGLIELLQVHAQNHNRDYFYAVRSWDHDARYGNLTNIQKAARTVYLNRTCFNGLYRVNRDGFFNVPLGSYATPLIDRTTQINAMHRYLANNDIQILNMDFASSVDNAVAGDVVYFDPPYDYPDNDANEGFIRYTAEQFDRDDLTRLSAVCDDLVNRGCTVVISNNDTEFVRQCFPIERYNYIQILGRRMINNLSYKRNGVSEVIIVGR